ncbi:hypothetical protein ACIHBQ_25765 [Streptomyces sp. NPDC052492]|uniref:hypothetical protein n=1 Tax=unclassified Streptomyces TaxID=2593676 RepID=UPI0037D95359
MRRPGQPQFRRRPARQLAGDPRIDRYLDLVAEVATESGPAAGRTPCTAHDWLLAALATETGTPLPASV